MADLASTATLELRDIHLPEPVSGWPPAPGWLLLPLLLIVAAGAAVLLRRWLRRKTVRGLALRELEALRVRSEVAPREQVQDLSMLLRRVCVSQFPRQEVAGLTGEAWLNFLDARLKNPDFSQGPGRLLLEAPYQRDLDGDVDISALYALCRQWLKTLPRKTL